MTLKQLWTEQAQEQQPDVPQRIPPARVQLRASSHYAWILLLNEKEGKGGTSKQEPAKPPGNSLSSGHLSLVAQGLHGCGKGGNLAPQDLWACQVAGCIGW